jgi:hypothetical protein
VAVVTQLVVCGDGIRTHSRHETSASTRTDVHENRSRFWKPIKQYWANQTQDNRDALGGLVPLEKSSLQLTRHTCTR